jgi:hypothetical protein
VRNENDTRDVSNIELSDLASNKVCVAHKSVQNDCYYSFVEYFVHSGLPFFVGVKEIRQNYWAQNSRDKYKNLCNEIALVNDNCTKEKSSHQK